MAYNGKNVRWEDQLKKYYRLRSEIKGYRSRDKTLIHSTV